MIQNTGKVSSATENTPAKTEDKRWRMVDRTMRLNGFHPSALLEALHSVQDTFGFLDNEAMVYVAQGLRVPLSRVYAVATFYHHFTLKPKGEHTCVVCMGTACYIGGSSKLLETIRDQTGINPGETTGDGKLSLLTARCLGSCGLAPAAVFDGKVCGKLTQSALKDHVQRWTSNDPDV